ncbi:Uncharacterised protein [Mycobacteroides abscessus subsp. abscessus]|nr:Uncharacterised protein [Mycobacteroides abscessus subsp. abscessus]
MTAHPIPRTLTEAENLILTELHTTDPLPLRHFDNLLPPSLLGLAIARLSRCGIVAVERGHIRVDQQMRKRGA